MSRFDTTVYKCEVHDNADPDMEGRLEVQHPKLFGGKKHWVRGTTPFGGFNSGFVHIPPPGTVVLVMRTLDSDLSSEYFWFAVTQESSSGRLEHYDYDAAKSGLRPFDTVLSPSIPEYDTVYRGPNGIPEKFIWKSETGHKIELSEKVYNTPAGKGKVVVTQEDHILLESKTGKRILIDDGVGPEFSRILLDDGYGNFIKIQTDQDFHTGENSINVESVGNIHITSKTGEIFINVEKGSNAPIEIRNYGSSSIDIKCDNQDVNVSAGRDINAYAASSIYAYAASSIYAYAASGHVSVEASGNIAVSAHGNVEITSDANSHVSVSGTLNMHSLEDLNITSEKNINLTAEEIHLN